MSNLFKKAIVFGDVHFGKKGDSETHNKDCLNFIDWVIEQAAKHDCDTIINLGDWFDNRARIKIDTLSYSNQAIDKLVATDLPIHWLLGNHDMYNKTSRRVHSLPFLESGWQSSIHFPMKPIEIDDVMLAPWPVGMESTKITSTECKYVFGHFELPLFLMNAQIELPDRGGMHADHFVNCGEVYSGHFHKRQTKMNSSNVPVTYIGSPFGHNFNDVNDRDHGCMVLEWGKDPKYLNWKDGPNYNRVKLSTLVEKIEDDSWKSLYNKTSTIECIDDVGISMDESLEIKEILSEHVRGFTFRQNREEESKDPGQFAEFNGENIDQMVVKHLKMIDTEGSDYDSEILIKLYESAI